MLLRRRLNSLAAIAVLSASLLVANSGEAQARISQVQDGFEGNPRANWVVATGGSASAGFDLALGAAHSGDNNGWLLARDGWAFEGYWVPTNSVPGNAQCAAQFYMRSISNAQVGIEIWDAHDHLLFSTYPFIKGSDSYQAVDTQRWNLNGVNPVFVKAIIGADGFFKFVRLDDMTMQCYW
ncbi:hypothetical protein [Streptomyces sp. NBC_00354]|uniref:hypothetical protein n=1 Tax=unclassified Streptomyces TaxID=2593676 RepID=UPI002E25C361